MQNYLKIILSMIIWSTWGVLIRWIALPPVVVLFYTSLIASFLVPLVLAVRGDFPKPFFTMDSWYLFAGLAMASILNNITYFYALGHTTVSNAVFTHYTAPVLVAVLAPFVIAERLERVTLISLPLAAAGMTMIVLNEGGIRLNSVHLPGILAGTASGFGYAFMIMLTRRLSLLELNQKALVVLLWITVLATAPAVLSLDYSIGPRTAALLLITGVFHSTIAPLLYFSALKKVLAQHAAVLGYIEPLSAIPLAFLFLSETPPLMALFGGALILLSGYLVVHARMSVR
ncbi:MAG TPA: DMT family transporter [Nitrospirota bacterium]|nr:DMT family transporter [Nitrospirota bacterium]